MYWTHAEQTRSVGGDERGELSEARAAHSQRRYAMGMLALHRRILTAFVAGLIGILAIGLAASAAGRRARRIG